MAKKWIGFDLDGTLAVYKNWIGFDHIGEPIAPMIDLAKKFIELGHEIRIVTARARGEGAIEPIQDWCEKNGLGRPSVTDRKDFDMIMLYDDRATNVVHNEGIVLEDNHRDMIQELSAKNEKLEAEVKELRWRLEEQENKS